MVRRKRRAPEKKSRHAPDLSGFTIWRQTRLQQQRASQRARNGSPTLEERLNRATRATMPSNKRQREARRQQRAEEQRAEAQRADAAEVDAALGLGGAAASGSESLGGASDGEDDQATPRKRRAGAPQPLVTPRARVASEAVTPRGSAPMDTAEDGPEFSSGQAERLARLGLIVPPSAVRVDPSSPAVRVDPSSPAVRVDRSSPPTPSLALPAFSSGMSSSPSTSIFPPMPAAPRGPRADDDMSLYTSESQRQRRKHAVPNWTWEQRAAILEHVKSQERKIANLETTITELRRAAAQQHSSGSLQQPYPGPSQQQHFHGSTQQHFHGPPQQQPYPGSPQQHFHGSPQQQAYPGPVPPHFHGSPQQQPYSGPPPPLPPASSMAHGWQDDAERKVQRAALPPPRGAWPYGREPVTPTPQPARRAPLQDVSAQQQRWQQQRESAESTPLQDVSAQQQRWQQQRESTPLRPAPAPAPALHEAYDPTTALW